MIDIVQIIFEQFSDRKIDPDSEYKKSMNKVIDNTIKLDESLSNEQRLLFKNYEKSTFELQSLNDYELIRFVLDFVSHTINFNKKR